MQHSDINKTRAFPQEIWYQKFLVVPVTVANQGLNSWHTKSRVGYVPHPLVQCDWQVNASITPVLAFALKSTKKKGNEGND